MKLKNSLESYSKVEFLELLQEIFDAKGTDEYQDSLLDNFIAVTQHPAGSDLIYYPETPADSTPERIAEIVKEWRLSQGLEHFKE